jgi:hypothetical protein
VIGSSSGLLGGSLLGAQGKYQLLRATGSSRLGAAKETLLSSLSKGSALSKGLGIGGILAGASLMTDYGIQGYSSAKSNGATSGQSILGALLSSVSGNSSVYGWSDTAKMNKAKNQKFDLSAMFKSAGAGALVGGGIGLLTSGPVGGAVGGAIGAVAGAASSATTQLVQMKRYTDLVNSDLSKLSDASSKSATKISETLTLQSDINKLEKTISDQKQELSTDDKSLTSEQLLQKKLDIQYNETLLRQKKQELGVNDSTIEDTEKIYKNLDKQKSFTDSLDKMQSVFESLGVSEGINGKVGSKESGESWYNSLSAEDKSNVYKSALQLAQSQGKDLTGLSDKEIAIGMYQSYTGNTKGKNYFNKVNSSGLQVGMWDTSTKQSLTNLSNTEQAASLVSSSASSFLNDSAVWSDSSNYTQIQKSVAALVGARASVGEKTSTLSDLGYNLNDAQDYLAWLSTNYQHDPNLYKLGVNRVSEDNELALLHKNEMVLTSTNADRLRDISGSSDPSRYLSVTSKSVKSVDTSNSYTNSDLSDVIVDQTDTISTLLKTILDTINQLVPAGSSRSSPTPATFSSINQNLLNFDRV